MGMIARLKYGAKEWNLYDDNYRVSRDFAPPAMAINLTASAGTSANRYGGLSAAGFSYSDRVWRIGLHVKASGATEATRRVNALNAFIVQCLNNPTEKLYFEHKPFDDYDFDPVWGQTGGVKRYQVKAAQLHVGSDYHAIFQQDHHLPNCTLEMTIAPVAEGLPQVLATATGSVVEFRAGVDDPAVRGLLVMPAITNKFTNPVFGHSTYNTGWTATNCTAARNYNRAYVFTGAFSAKLTKTGSGAYFTQSLAITDDDYIGFYCKKPDGSAVTASDVKVYCNGAESGSYIEIGNGWWLVAATSPGAGTYNTGVSLEGSNGSVIYVDAFMAREFYPYTVPHINGDMLDCTWSGTAHNSTSTSTNGKIFVNNSIIGRDQGTIRVVFRPLFSGGAGTDFYFFHLDNSATDFYGYYDQGSDVIIFSDGTNTATPATQADFVRGDPVILHFVWKLGTGLKIYRAGTEIATTATYTPNMGSNNLYIGGTGAYNNLPQGLISGFTVFDRAMTAAQVSADYNEVSGIAAAYEQVDAVPYLWTDDGDNIIDNCLDSSRENYAIIGGVQGSYPAVTEYRMKVETGGANTFDTDAALWLSRTSLYEYRNQVLGIFKDLGGTAVTGACGGSAEVLSVGTSPVTLSGTPPGYAALYNAEQFGTDYYLFVRMSDAGSLLTVAPRVYLAGSVSGAASYYTGDYRSITGGTAYKLFVFGPIAVADESIASIDRANYQALTPVFQRTSGTANVTVDFVAALPAPLLKFKKTGTITGVSSGIWAHVKGLGGKFETDQSSLEYFLQFGEATGQPVEVLPETQNVLFGFVGDDGAEHVITRTIDFSYVKVIPRWSII